MGNLISISFEPSTSTTGNKIYVKFNRKKKSVTTPATSGEETGINGWKMISGILSILLIGVSVAFPVSYLSLKSDLEADIQEENARCTSPPSRTGWQRVHNNLTSIPSDRQKFYREMSDESSHMYSFCIHHTNWTRLRSDEYDPVYTEGHNITLNENHTILNQTYGYEYACETRLYTFLIPMHAIFSYDYYDSSVYKDVSYVYDYDSGAGTLAFTVKMEDKCYGEYITGFLHIATEYNQEVQTCATKQSVHYTNAEFTYNFSLLNCSTVARMRERYHPETVNASSAISRSMPTVEYKECTCKSDCQHTIELCAVNDYMCEETCQELAFENFEIETTEYINHLKDPTSRTYPTTSYLNTQSKCFWIQKWVNVDSTDNAAAGPITVSLTINSAIYVQLFMCGGFKNWHSPYAVVGTDVSMFYSSFTTKIQGRYMFPCPSLAFVVSGIPHFNVAAGLFLHLYGAVELTLGTDYQHFTTGMHFGYTPAPKLQVGTTHKSYIISSDRSYYAELNGVLSLSPAIMVGGHIGDVVQMGAVAGFQLAAGAGGDIRYFAGCEPGTIYADGLFCRDGGPIRYTTCAMLEFNAFAKAIARIKIPWLGDVEFASGTWSPTFLGKEWGQLPCLEPIKNLMPGPVAILDDLLGKVDSVAQQSKSPKIVTF